MCRQTGHYRYYTSLALVMGDLGGAKPQMMMMTMMQRWACQRRHKQSTVHSIIDIDQNEARTDPRWVLFEMYKKIPFYVIQKSVSELHRYLPTYLT